jgi:hypothetical protein
MTRTITGVALSCGNMSGERVMVFELSLIAQLPMIETQGFSLRQRQGVMYPFMCNMKGDL